MASPLPPSPDDYNLLRANWLGRYLDVENGAVDKLSAVLSDAADSIDDTFNKFVPKNFSGQVTRSRLALVSKAIRDKVKGIFGDTTNIIKNGQENAAVAAVNAQLYSDKSVLSQMFSSQADRDQYADSLRQTAKRNIDAVMTRVLETEKPLSTRVYHTQAIANGQVNQIINRSLAKGESAAELAKAVKSSILPNTPGGVSYAAKRLARTEINNAFHAQSIHDSQESPWVEQMEWNLSKTHKEDPGDECEQYAKQKLFPKENVPEKPHPNCRCFVTPKAMDYDQFENALVAGQFNSYVDNVMGKTGTLDDTIAPIAEHSKGSDIEPPDEEGQPKARSKADQVKVQEHKKRLQESFPDSIVTGFDDPSIDPRAAKSLVDGYIQAAEKFPKAKKFLGRVGFRPFDSDIYGESRRNYNNFPIELQRTYGNSADYSAINLKHAQDVKNFKEIMKQQVEDKYFQPVMLKDPYKQVALHEFGHVIQYMFNGNQAMDATYVRRYLQSAHKASVPLEQRNLDDFYKWVKEPGQLSGYSFRTENGIPQRDFQDINIPEAISEAFANVEMGAGTEAEKGLYQMVLDFYEDGYGNE